MPSSWPARPPGAPAWDAQDARGVGAGVPRAGRPAAVCRSRLCEHCGHAALSRPAWRQRPKLQRPAAAGTGRRAGARTRREQQPPQLAPHAQDRRNRQAAHAQAQLQPEAQRAEVARAVRLPRGARAPSAVRAPPETAPVRGGGSGSCKSKRSPSARRRAAGGPPQGLCRAPAAVRHGPALRGGRACEQSVSRPCARPTVTEAAVMLYSDSASTACPSAAAPRCPANARLTSEELNDSAACSVTGLPSRSSLRTQPAQLSSAVGASIGEHALRRHSARPSIASTDGTARCGRQLSPQEQAQLACDSSTSRAAGMAMQVAPAPHRLTSSHTVAGFASAAPATSLVSAGRSSGCTLGSGMARRFGAAA